jgi:plastocyanin
LHFDQYFLPERLRVWYLARRDDSQNWYYPQLAGFARDELGPLFPARPIRLRAGLGRAVLTTLLVLVIALAAFSLYFFYPGITSSGSSSTSSPFTLSLTPPQIIVAPGLTVSYATLAAKTLPPSNGTLYVTVSAPVGLSLALSQQSINPHVPQDIRLNLTASSNVAPGQYLFLIEARLGSTTYNQTFPVKVVPALVLMQFVAFSPSSLTVKRGTTVTWLNLDSQIGCCDPGYHTVVFNTQTNASSPALARFATWSYDFEKTGDFSYYCSIHLYMTGRVVVVP